MKTRFLVLAVLLPLLICGLAVAAKDKPVKDAKAAPSPAPAPGPGDIVASIGDQNITRAELLKEAANALAKIRLQEYEILADTLDQIIDDKLVQAEAAKEQKAPEQFLKERIEDKLPVPTDEAVNQFYEANKGQMRGATLEQVKPQIVARLQNTDRQKLAQDLFASLRNAAKVRILLDPPRSPVSEDDDPVRGPANAPVSIIAFSDYQCPYCSRAEATMNQIRNVYGDKVKLVFRDYPLNFHRNAQKAAEAAGCALEQGKFWELHDKLFANQNALEIANLTQFAEQVGLNMDAFKKCLDSNQRAPEVKKDTDDGVAVGVTGTPAFFVNGRMVSGAQPFENFAKVINDELERKGITPPPMPPPPAPAPKPAVTGNAAVQPAEAKPPVPANPPAPAPAPKPVPPPPEPKK